MPKILQPTYSNPYILETFLSRYSQYIDQDVRKTASPTFANVTITDSLNYGGVINRTDQEISDFQDNILLLNSGVDTTVTPLSLAGFEIFRGSAQANAYLKFDNSKLVWTTGFNNGDRNLLLTVPTPIDPSLDQGLLLYDSVKQSCSIGNTIPNALTFNQSSTYTSTGGIIFSQLSTGLTWSDGVSLLRHNVYDRLTFDESPISLQNGSLQLTGSQSLIHLAGQNSRIIFGSFDGASIQSDSSGAILAKNLSATITSPSLITDSINDSIPNVGPPSVSLKAKGAIFTNRSLYLGPCDNPGDSTPAAYRISVPSIQDPNNPILKIANVLNTVAGNNSIVSFEGAQSTIQLRNVQINGASGCGFLQTKESSVILSSNDDLNSPSYSIQLITPQTDVSGNLNVGGNMSVDGAFVPKQGIQEITVTASDSVNSSQPPSVIGAIMLQPSANWCELKVCLMFLPEIDNESSITNITLPNMTNAIQDYSHVFCSILSAWRQPDSNNMIPLEGVHILPQVQSQKVQIYFTSETTEAHYISASILYRLSG